jgi:hypothetical protein
MLITITQLLVCLCRLPIICLIFHVMSLHYELQWIHVMYQDIYSMFYHPNPPWRSSPLSDLLPTNHLEPAQKEKVYAFLLTNVTLQSFLEKLLVTQLVMKFSAFNGSATFIAMLTRSTTSPHSEPSEPLHILPPYFFKAHFYVHLPSPVKSRSSKMCIFVNLKLT